jgi:hypothetical protein
MHYTTFTIHYILAHIPYQETMTLRQTLPTLLVTFNTCLAQSLNFLRIPTIGYLANLHFCINTMAASTANNTDTTIQYLFTERYLILLPPHIGEIYS